MDCYWSVPHLSVLGYRAEVPPPIWRTWAGISEESLSNFWNTPLMSFGTNLMDVWRVFGNLALVHLAGQCPLEATLTTAVWSEYAALLYAFCAFLIFGAFFFCMYLYVLHPYIFAAFGCWSVFAVVGRTSHHMLATLSQQRLLYKNDLINTI